MRAHAGWRRGNVPLPETSLVGLGVGLVLQGVAPWRPPWPAGAGRVVGWPLLLPGVLLATHVVVVREERSLEARFGAAYRSYRSSVRRYL